MVASLRLIALPFVEVSFVRRAAQAERRSLVELVVACTES